MAGIDHVEIESVDGYPLAGNHDQSIITFYAPDGGTFEPGKDYVVTTFPCDVSSGYDAYADSKGNCGGIDFWGNSWEQTSTKNEAGLYLVKGGSWDSSRDACRSEYSDDARDGAGKYANVGFRVVRVDKQ